MGRRPTPIVILLAEPLGQGAVGGWVGKIGRNKRQVSRKGGPGRIIGFTATRELIDAFTQVLAKFVIAHVLKVEADNGEMIRQPVVDEQAVERRHQLAPGQVAAGAEDH
jgi:hypothetical protein